MKPAVIDPKNTTRAAAFELWMDAPNPMVTFFKTLDITPLACLSRRRGLYISGAVVRRCQRGRDLRERTHGSAAGHIRPAGAEDPQALPRDAGQPGVRAGRRAGHVRRLLPRVAGNAGRGGVAKDTRQASVIASILYFPMLLFSGTTLPLGVMPKAMQTVVGVFPLTQGITMMKNAFLGIGPGSILPPICVMLALTALCTLLSLRFFRWE